MHQKPPQSAHKIQNFLGGMPPDPLEVVGPRAHQVPWLAPASRYAPDDTCFINYHTLQLGITSYFTSTTVFILQHFLVYHFPQFSDK